MRTFLFLVLTVLGTAWTASDAQAFWLRRNVGNKPSYTNVQPSYSTGYSTSSSSSSSNNYYHNNRGSGYWPGYSNFSLNPFLPSNSGLVNGRPVSNSSSNGTSTWQR